jgi:hypothetical protein
MSRYQCVPHSTMSSIESMKHIGRLKGRSYGLVPGHSLWSPTQCDSTAVDDTTFHKASIKGVKPASSLTHTLWKLLLPFHLYLAIFQLSSPSSSSNLPRNQTLPNLTLTPPKIHTRPPCHYVASPKLSGALYCLNFSTQYYWQKLAT